MAKPKFPLQWVVLTIVLALGALVFWPSPAMIKSLRQGDWPSPLSSPQNLFQFFSRAAGQGLLASWLNAWFNPGADGVGSINDNGLNNSQGFNSAIGPGRFQPGHGGTGSGGNGSASGAGNAGAGAGKGSGSGAGQGNAGVNSNASQNSSAATAIYPTVPSGNNNGQGGGNNNNGNGSSGSDNGSGSNGSDNSGSGDQGPGDNSGNNSGSNGSSDNNNSGNNPDNGPGNSSSGGSSGGSGSGSGSSNPGSGNGAGDNGGFSPCVQGCYAGCIPGCDAQCTPPSCNLGVNPNNLPTANPVPSDSDVSQNVSVQDQANQRVAELLASRAALVAPVQQQAQASKYETINTDNMPDQPSSAQAPADVQAKIQAHQLNLH